MKSIKTSQNHMPIHDARVISVHKMSTKIIFL